MPAIAGTVAPVFRPGWQRGEARLSSAGRDGRRLAIYLVPLTFLALLLGPVAAHAFQLHASVDRTELGMDDQVKLTLTVVEEGVPSPDPLNLPDLADWVIVRRDSDQSKGATRSGKLRITSRYRFVLQPRRLGPATIGPATMTRNGQQHSTEAIALRVRVTSPFDAGPGAGPFDLAPDFDPALEGLEPDAFLLVVPEPTDPYLGQQVTVTYRLYAQGAVVAGYPVDRPMFPDFHVEGLEVSRSELEWHDVRIQGRKYIAKSMVRYAVFPTRAGPLELDAFVMDIDVARSWESPDPPQRIRRASRPFRLEVRPLPAEGQPEGFPSTNVGEFTLQARLSQDEVLAGEPVQLSITARGQGNVQLLAPPRVGSPPGLRILGPESRAAPGRLGLSVVGSRGWVYQALAHRPGRYRIPPASLPYFDPAAGEYRTAESQPLELRVTAVPGAPAVDTDEPGAEEPRGVRAEAPMRACSTPMLRSPSFLAALVLPPAAYLALLALGLVRRRAEARRARSQHGRQRAASESGKALRRAGSGGASSPAEVRRGLLLFLEGRLGLVTRGATREELGLAAREAGLDGSQAERLTALLARCERAISRPGDAGDIAGLLAEARALMKELEALGVERGGEA